MQALNLHAQHVSKLLLRWVAAKFLHQPLTLASNAIESSIDIDWQANSAALISHSSTNRLTNPPGSVSAEAVPAAPVIALDGSHQANVTFLDEIEQRQTPANVALGDTYHQTQVRQYKLLHGVLVARLDALGQINLLRMAQHRHATDFAEVCGDRIHLSGLAPLNGSCHLMDTPEAGLACLRFVWHINQRCAICFH